MISSSWNGDGIYFSFVNVFLFKYPFETLSPAIYKVPGIPFGTKFKSLSNIYPCKLYKGFPIGIMLYFLQFDGVT